MATPKGKIISISPGKFTVGNPVTLVVDWTTEWSDATWITYTVGVVNVTLADGTVLEASQHYYGGHKNQFSSSFSLGQMTEEPIILTVDLYQSNVSLASLTNWAGLLALITGNPSNHSDGPYTHTIDPTQEDINPPSDPTEFIKTYGPWIAGGSLVLILGLWANKNFRRPQQ